MYRSSETSTKNPTEFTKTDLQKIIREVKKNLSNGFTREHSIENTAASLDISTKDVFNALKIYKQSNPDTEFKRGHIKISENVMEIVRIEREELAKRNDLQLSCELHLKGQAEEALLSYRLSEIFQMDLIYSPEFKEPKAEAKIMAEIPSEETKSKKSSAPKGLPAYLASLYEYPVLTKNQEAHLFRKFNFIKHNIITQRIRLNSENPNLLLLSRLEKMHSEAYEVRNCILKHNLRLGVSVAKSFCRGDMGLLFEKVSEANETLIKAIEKYDYGRGWKFSTYATWALRKNFIRSLQTEDKYRSRTQTDTQSVIDTIEGNISEAPLSLRDKEIKINEAAKVRMLLERLDEREKAVICMRYGIDCDPMTLKEVGQVFGVTKERIRQIQLEALSKLS